MTALRFEPDRISIKMSRSEAAQLLEAGHLIERCQIPGGGRLAWSVRIDDAAPGIDVEGLAFLLPRHALAAELECPGKEGLVRTIGGTVLQIQVDIRRPG